MRKRLRIAIVGYGTGRQASVRDMSPQLGQGVNMALLDARALRDALREHESVAGALAIYKRHRRAHVGIYHFWSRWLTPLFHPTNAVRVERRAARPAGKDGVAGGFVGELAAIAKPREPDKRVSGAPGFEVSIESAVE